MSPVEPIARTALALDLSPRFPVTTTVVASPAAAAETIIGSLTIPNFANLAIVSGIQLSGWCAYTVGTNGTAVTIRIRQTNVTGAVVASTGALTKTAASLYTDDVGGTDAAPSVGVYVMTMIVTSGSASTAVSGLSLAAIVV